MPLLQRITRSYNLAMIVVIHNLSLALRFADRFVLLNEGRLFAAGGPEIITSEAICAVYHIDAVIHDCSGECW